jgi:replicative DNA helicase
MDIFLPDMPKNIEAEQAVLGTLLVSADSLKYVSLSHTDFCIEIHQNLFTVIQNQIYKNGQSDIIFIRELIKKENTNFTETEINGYIKLLSEHACHPPHLKQYSQLIREKARLRSLYFLANNVTESVRNGSGFAEISDDIYTGLELAKQGYSTENSDNNAFLEEYERSLTEPPKTIKTGISLLDKLTCGVRIPSLFTIGARPSTGKTALALNIAGSFLRLTPTANAVIFSLEMSAAEITDRLISACKIAPYSQIQRRQLDGEQLKKAKNYIDWLKQNRLVVVDNCYYAEQIAGVVRRLKPQLVVVDFAQIADTHEKYENVRVKMNIITAKLKQIAKQNECCILLLSQITRTGRDKPTMSDLLESGALVLLLKSIFTPSSVTLAVVPLATTMRSRVVTTPSIRLISYSPLPNVSNPVV